MTAERTAPSPAAVLVLTETCDVFILDTRDFGPDPDQPDPANWMEE